MATDQDLSQKNKTTGWGDGAACKAILCEYKDLSLDLQTHVEKTEACTSYPSSTEAETAESPWLVGHSG